MKKRLDDILKSVLKKPAPKQTYLVLVFESHVVKALLFEMVDNKAQVLKISVQTFKEDLSQEVVTAVDLATTELEEKKTNISKVIFGIPYFWVEEAKIKPQYQSFLKKLSSELALTPVGFVVNQEALPFYLGNQEGVPLNAILVQIEDQNLNLTLLKSGKVAKAKTQAFGQDISLTIMQILKEISLSEVLPSRMLLYGDQNNLEEIKQQLISIPWLSHINFLHFPKIDVLENNLDLKSAAYAGATEIAKNDKIKLIFDTEVLGEKEQVPKVFQSLPKQANDEIPMEKVKIENEEIGFVQDEDILEKTSNIEKVEDNNFELEKVISVPSVPSQFKIPKLPNIFSFLKKVNLPKIRINSFNPSFFSGWFTFFGQSKSLILIVAVVLILLISSLILYFNILKANVILSVEPKFLEKNSEVTILHTTSLIDENKKTIPGKTTEIAETGSLSQTATGSKIVGEKAKGQVTIFNKTTTGKSYPNGTAFSVGDLKFSLDSSASVSAQSENPDGSGATYGKLKVNITADSVGTKSNLPANSSFKIGDQSTSSFEAKNEQALSGGSSKEVTVVSKEDQDKLLKTLSQNLLEKAKSDIIGKQDGNQKVIEPSINSTIAKKQFSKAIDTEAKDVSLDLEMKFKGLSYNDGDLKSLMEKMVSGEVPDGYLYESQNGQDQVEIKEVKKDGTVVLKVNFKAKLLPKIDVADIQKSLRGKSVGAGRKYLELYKNVSSFAITFTPKLPGFLQAFPQVAQNIKVEVASK